MRHSTAATAPRRGRPQARRSTALDGASSALERAAWPPLAAAVRGAASAHPCWHTHAYWPNARLPLTGAVAIAAQVAGVRARPATAERARARPRGAPAPAGARARAPRVSTPLSSCSVERETSRPRLGSRLAPRLGGPACSGARAGRAGRSSRSRGRACAARVPTREAALWSPVRHP